MDMCMHVECSMKIKRHPLHNDSCSRDNMVKLGRFNEDLMIKN